MSCREGTLYSARLMTCDHASNVKNCKSKHVPPSALGLLKPNNLAKMPWYTPPDTKTEATNNIASIPKVQIRNYNLRDLPPLPGVPVPPPRRKKSVVEIQNIESGFSGVDENENTQSIA